MGAPGARGNTEQASRAGSGTPTPAPDPIPAFGVTSFGCDLLPNLGGPPPKFGWRLLQILVDAAPENGVTCTPKNGAQPPGGRPWVSVSKNL